MELMFCVNYARIRVFSDLYFSLNEKIRMIMFLYRKYGLEIYGLHILCDVAYPERYVIVRRSDVENKSEGWIFYNIYNNKS